MISIKRAKNRINNIYKLPKECLYSHRFYEDLCSGYSYILGKRNIRNDFLTFEPNGCTWSNLLKRKQYSNFSYDMEQIISRTVYALLNFGKAYIYLIPEYTTVVDSDNKENKTLVSMRIEEVEGYIRKCYGDDIIFCRKGFNGKIDIIEMKSNQLIELDIKEAGFKKNYFVNILRRLSKCDITKTSMMMFSDNVSSYDFVFHSKKRKILELRATRDIGWTFGGEGLSESYSLYKKIQGDKLKLQLLNYIIRKMNEGLKKYKVDSTGELVAHIIDKDYDQLWKEYLQGKITGTELSRILYNLQ